MQSANEDRYSAFLSATSGHELAVYLAANKHRADFFVTPSPDGWRPIDRLQTVADFRAVTGHLHQQGSRIPMSHWLAANNDVVPAQRAARCGYLYHQLEEWRQNDEILPASAWQTQNGRQRTLLHAMTANSLPSYLKIVEETGGAIPGVNAWHVADTQGDTPFAKAALRKHTWNLIEWMPAHQQPLPGRDQLTQPNKKGETPLGIMLDNSQFENAIRLLELTGSHLQLEDVTTGPMPGTRYPRLSSAITGDCMQIVAEAVSRSGKKLTKAHLTEPGPNGYTLMHTTGLYGSWDQIVPVLRISGETLTEADLALLNKHSQTPLSYTIGSTRLNDLVAAAAEVGEKGLVEKLVALDDGNQLPLRFRVPCCSGASQVWANVRCMPSATVLEAVRAKLNPDGATRGGGAAITGL
jgi:hypothetical protein